MTPDEARSRRRALAKQHHPDLGGDAAEFDRAMRSSAPAQPHPQHDQRPDTQHDTQHDIVFTPSARTRLRRGVAATRASLGTQVQRLARHLRSTP